MTGPIPARSTENPVHQFALQSQTASDIARRHDIAERFASSTSGSGSPLTLDRSFSLPKLEEEAKALLDEHIQLLKNLSKNSDDIDGLEELLKEAESLKPSHPSQVKELLSQHVKRLNPDAEQRKDTVKEEHRKILERLAGLTLRSPEQRSWVQRQITTLTDPHYLERTSTTRQREFEQIDAQIHRIQIEDRKYDEIDPNRIGLEKAIPSIKSNLDAIQSSKLEYAPAEAFLKQACAYFRYHLERVERSLPQIQTPDQMDEAKAQFTIIVNELAPLADLLKQLFPADASEEKKAEGLKTLQNIVPINTEALANKALFELGNMIKNYQIHEALRTSAQSALNRINTELPNTQKQGDNAVFKLVAVSCYKVLQSVQNGRRVEAAISREQEFLEQSTEILRDSDEAKAYEALLKTRPQSFEDAAVDEWNVKLNQAKNKVLDLHRTSLETRIRELESKAGAVDVPKVLRLGLPKEVQALRARTEESDFAKFETDVLQIHADCQSLLRSVEAPNHPLADPMKKRLLDHAKEAALHEMEKLKESVEDYALHDEVDDIKSEIDRLRVRNLSNPMLGSLTEYDALLSPPRLDSIREMIGNEPLHPSRLQEELLKHLKDENGPYAKALAIHNEALRLQLSGPPWRAVEEFLKEFSNIEGSAAPSRFDPRRIERCFNEIAIETTGDPEIACPGRLLLPLRTLKAAIEDESNSEIGDVALKERTEALRKTLSPLVTHMENALKRRLAIEQGRTLEEFTSSSMRAIDLARTNAPCLLTTLDKCLPLLEQKQAIASASLESERTAFEPNIAELMEWLRSPHSFQEQSERLDQLVNATDPLRLEDLQKDFRYAAIMELQSLVRGLEYPSSELKTLSKILEDAPIIDFSFEQLDSLRTQILEAIDKATPRWAKAWRTVDNAAREIFEIYKHRTG